MFFNTNFTDSTTLLMGGKDENNIYAINTPAFNSIIKVYDEDIQNLNVILAINNNFVAIGTND